MVSHRELKHDGTGIRRDSQKCDGRTATCRNPADKRVNNPVALGYSGTNTSHLSHRTPENTALTRSRRSVPTRPTRLLSVSDRGEACTRK